MRQSFWLASYPKSGNTWFRVLLANLQMPGEAAADINRIDSTDAIASARRPFDGLMMLESGMMRREEIDALRPLLYTYLAETADEDVAGEAGLLDALPVRFVKTHDAWSLTARGTPLMGGRRAAAGAILIVRDPRDVAISFANHLGRSVDRVIADMADPGFALVERSESHAVQFRQLLTDWSGFNAGWLDQREVPVHLVRYEDLQADAARALSDALAFAGWRPNAAAIARAVAKSGIVELQRQEQAYGFREAPPRGMRFFRRGIAGAWRDELTDAQVARIEAAHAPLMQRLGYIVSGGLA